MSCHSTLVALVGITGAILTNVQENLEDDFEIKQTLGITLVGFTCAIFTKAQENLEDSFEI